MRAATRPEAIDAGSVLRVYGGLSVGTGTVLVAWGPRWLPAPGLTDLPWGDAALLRTAGAALLASGCCALVLAAADAPHARRLGLYGLAAAHLIFGAVFFLQWSAVLEPVVPQLVGAAPFVVGGVLMYLALTGPDSDFPAAGGLISLFGGIRRNQHDLRATYEAEIRRAARQEERGRLARDLHDAVKQQLFVVQTAAATAETRLERDPAGARTAIAQVRTAGRDAMREMQLMLDQLQATPLGNAGLVESIRNQTDALAARTGVAVRLDIGDLPPDEALEPGAREAVFRIAQEALANVARHARATHVYVSLAITGQELILIVRDDGRGYDPDTIARGMGLSNVRARADEAGATLDMRAAPGRGTTIRLAVPYDRRSANEYVWKAAGWALILLLWLLVGWDQGARLYRNPALMVAVGVALIGVARHAYAAYRLRSSRATA